MVRKATSCEIWQPKYTITNAAVNGLTRIEAARAVVEGAILPPGVVGDLSRQARIRATHYSTRIEGNRLTLEEAADVVEGRKRVFHGRERDVAEVRNYWDALAKIEEWASEKKPVTEKLIQRIAGTVLNGNRARTEPYRTGQNVIRDSVSGAIVYLPPEAHDVPRLMGEMVGWVGQAFAEQTPTVVIAALAHYQFVTIHPYYDGNGRTARLLSTYALHVGGYGLGGIYSLEQYHSRDIAAYYGALDVGGHHNYYLGRADADLTPWLEFFVSTLVEVFESSKDEALKYAQTSPVHQPEEVRRLDYRARTALALFAAQDEITSGDVARTLALSGRMARVLLAEWVASGWLVISDPSRKARTYALSPSVKRYMEEQQR